jgi:excisionase family DNA binding protein
MTPTTLAAPPFFLADNLAIATPHHDDLTIAQAADVLACSEKHVERLLDAERMEFYTLDGERLITRESFSAYVHWLNETHEAINEIVRENQELGLYDD